MNRFEDFFEFAFKTFIDRNLLTFRYRRAVVVSMRDYVRKQLLLLFLICEFWRKYSLKQAKLLRWRLCFSIFMQAPAPGQTLLSQSITNIKKTCCSSSQFMEVCSSWDDICSKQTFWLKTDSTSRVKGLEKLSTTCFSCLEKSLNFHIFQ